MKPAAVVCALALAATLPGPVAYPPLPAQGAAIVSAPLAISGLDKVEPHKLVRLAIEGEVTSAVWTVFPFGSADLEIYDAGRKCVFTAPPGTYHIQAVALSGGQLRQLQRAVEIGPVGPAPNPPGPTPPAPVPPPYDPYTPPDSLVGLEKTTWQAIMNIAKGVDPRTVTKWGQQIGGAYEGAAAQIAAGTITTVTAAVEAVGTALKEQLSADPQLDKLRPALKAIADSVRGAKNLQELADQLRAVAKGAKAVRL